MKVGNGERPIAELYGCDWRLSVSISDSLSRPIVVLMKCIFCKSRSETSRSREHIIPESLGNKDYVLPPGWVCDPCNNYLARKVEAKFLDSDYGQRARFEMRVENKEGRVPPTTGFSMPAQVKVHLQFHQEDGISISAANLEDEGKFIESLTKTTHGRLYLPSATLPRLDYSVARFIAKVGLECLAFQCLHIPGWNEEIVSKDGLDKIRNYVRRGRPGFVWPVNIRRIYEADHPFKDEKGFPYQSLHEWDLLVLPTSIEEEVEVYAVVAIFGVEYAINLGDANLDSFLRWLRENNGRSPLYPSSDEFKAMDP